MKITLLALLLTLVLAHENIAQHGPKLGLALSSIKGYDNDLNSKPILLPSLGYFFTIEQTREIFLRPEILVSVKGTHLSGTGSSSDQKLTERIAYAEIPFFLVYTNAINKVQFNLKAGPSLSTPIVGWWKYTESQFPGNNDNGRFSIANTVDDDNINKHIGKRAIKRFDFAVNFGLELIHKDFLIEIAYSIGLVDRTSNSSTSNFKSGQQQGLFNRQARIAVGYNFGY